jgi:hypothetical protein
MRPTSTHGATHCFSKPENWNDEVQGKCGDLEVRVQLDAANTIQYVSTWRPGAADLALLNAGGVIEVGLCQDGQPAMWLEAVPSSEAGDPPGTERAPVTINEHAHGDDAP